MATERDAINEWYDSFAKFVEKYNLLYVSELDYYITRNINIYTVYEQLDIAEIKLALEKLKANLPSIGRIFTKPIIHLIEQDEILPVESIRYIGSNSINHVASHSELWDDLTDEGVKPRKLLSRTYIDNYSIYENVVFANTIDLILYYLRSRAKILDDLMFSQKLKEVNLLERTNHLDYYLALGKLHTGYIRTFDRYLGEVSSIKSGLISLYQTISSRLYKKVYRLNKNRTISSLHKTNILSMHKDYKRIYSLYKYFNDFKREDVLMWLDFDNPNYYWFCQILTYFAIEHFGFMEDERSKIDFYSPNLKFSCDRYHLLVTADQVDERRVIILTFTNDKTYKIALEPLCKYVKDPKVVEVDGVDKTYLLSPLQNDETVLVGLTELNSFRRVQQILLNGMIASTERFDVCPFCKGKLVKDEEKERYVCGTCNQVIEKLYCPDKQEYYYNTDVKALKISADELFDVESRLNFRNINKVTAKSFVCPLCKKIH